MQQSLHAGLLGNNWLYLLDMVKRNVLQMGATVIPAAATLYCMGVEARTQDVHGFDFSSLNKYRWAVYNGPLAHAGASKIHFSPCSGERKESHHEGVSNAKISPIHVPCHVLGLGFVSTQ